MMNKFGPILKDFLEYEGIGVKEFASRIDTSPKNLIDILNGNIEISQNMIYNISFITGIPVSYIENVENNFKLDKKIDDLLKEENINIRDYINRFHYKELTKEYGISFTNDRNDYSIAKDILKYLRISNPKSLYKENNSIFYKSKNDKVELLAIWLEKCYRIAKEQQIKEYTKENIETLVTFIKEEALKNEFDEKKLIHKFNENGIYLVIQDDLKGSKIRGAFKVFNDKPAIYLTKKHKRIADIYFALLHELAHCKSDFNRAKSGSMVSYLDENDSAIYEKEADAKAFNWLVENTIYDEIKENKDCVLDKRVVPAFLVYRMAYDKIISCSSKLYQKYNIVIRDK